MPPKMGGMARNKKRTASTVHFREVQHLRQWWLWAIVLFAGGAFGVAVATGQDQVAGVIIGGGAWAGATALLLFANLSVEVRGDGIHLRQLWLFRRHFAFDRIASYEARTYRPIREYLGWGVRFGPSGTAYSMSGDRGVQLILGDGSRVLIGSQRADEFAAAMDAAAGGRRR